MRNKLIAGLLTVLVAALIPVSLLFMQDTEDEITAEEAREAAAALYGGEAVAAEETETHYAVELNRSGAGYLVLVHKETGQVESLERIQESGQPDRLTEAEAEAAAAEETGGQAESIRYNESRDEYEVTVQKGNEQSVVVISAETGEIRRITAESPEPEPDPAPSRIITAEEAAAIAVTVLDGEVQEAEFTETGDGGYYLVEVENDETDQEVTVQIHAVRGEILTVEWED